MLGDCTLCRVVEEGLAGGRPFYDTHLLQTPSFVVIPAVGPVCPGHVMVVSRIHAPNLASLSRAALAEYNDLIETIQQNPSRGLFELLEAEHGATEGERGGACITHVHVNVIPYAASFVTMCDGMLPTQPIDLPLAALAPSAAPYVLLRSSHSVRLHTATNAPSQLIRRVLFARLGREDWDWAVFPHYDVISATLAMWREGS